MAITLNPVRPVTDEELVELSERNPGYQFERTATGELIVTPTGGQAGERELELGRQLGNWAARDRRGVAFGATTMFVLPDGSRYMPDASWVLRERYQQLTPQERRGWLPLCPDAAFEILSPSDRAADTREKTRVYVRNGARVAVLLNPDDRTGEVHRPGHDPEVLRNPANAALDPELPGFVLDLGPLFQT